MVYVLSKELRTVGYMYLKKIYRWHYSNDRQHKLARQNNNKDRIKKLDFPRVLSRQIWTVISDDK